jgi:hypothetical protein
MTEPIDSIHISLQSQNKTGMGSVSLQTWTRKQSIKKGISSLLACWALALATMPITVMCAACESEISLNPV